LFTKYRKGPLNLGQVYKILGEVQNIFREVAYLARTTLKIQACRFYPARIAKPVAQTPTGLLTNEVNYLVESWDLQGILLYLR
jgi:hypothetical protein